LGAGHTAVEQRHHQRDTSNRARSIAWWWLACSARFHRVDWYYYPVGPMMSIDLLCFSHLRRDCAPVNMRPVRPSNRGMDVSLRPQSDVHHGTDCLAYRKTTGLSAR
jgi:hypothetical protein